MSKAQARKQKPDLSTYETLLLNITLNAIEKIVSAATLYNTKYAYRDSLFLLIIAQEELSKIILLTFANAADDVEGFANIANHKGPYFQHSAKHQAFVSFAKQDRSYKKLEKIKQGCLYIGLDRANKSTRYVVKEPECYKELCNALQLYAQLIPHSLHMAPTNQVSPDVKEMIALQSSEMLIPAIKDKVPNAAEELKEYVRKKTADGEKGLVALKEGHSSDKYLHDLIMGNPFMFVDMVSYALTSKHLKAFFSEVVTTRMTPERIIDNLYIYLEKEAS